MTSVSTERLASIFVEVADTLVDEFDLLDFLHMLTGRAVDLVDGAAVGLLLSNHRGELEFMASSDEASRIVELFQLQNREGPCLEAFRTGQAVINVDLSQAYERWPAFAPKALELGFRSVHAFPLRLRSEVIGAMNVFGTSTGGNFTGSDVPIMQALADVAAIGIIQERVIRRGEVLVQQLQNALNSRIVIEQAKGVVAQATGVSVDAAFDMIRDYARKHQLRLTDVARTVVTDLPSLPELSGN